MKQIPLLIEIGTLPIYYFYAGISAKVAGVMFLLFFLLKISYIDYKTYMIPDKMLIFITLGGLMHHYLKNEFFLFYDIFFAVLFISIVFLPIYFLTDSIGGGDIKLSYALCLWLPYPFIAEAIFFAVLAASFVGIYLLLKDRCAFNSAIPFGPFIALGTLLVFIFSN